MLGLELNIYNGLLLLVLGFSCGVLSGFFGVGGAFILTPSLNVLGLPMVNAVATGISFTVFSSSLGGVKHYLKKNTLLKVGIMVGLITLVGVRISQPLVIYLDRLNIAGFYIRFVYILLLIILGGTTLIKGRDNGDDEDNGDNGKGEGRKRTPQGGWTRIPPLVKIGERRVSIWSVLIIGLFVGFLQGFMGVGGGFVLVPLFILILRMNTHKAVGTSLLVIFISSIFGTYLYILSGKVIFFVVITLSAGTFFGVNFGVKAINNIDPENLSKFYSIFLLLASLGIIFRQFGLVTVSLVYTFGLVFLITLLVLIRYYFNLDFSTIKEALARE